MFKKQFTSFGTISAALLLVLMLDSVTVSAQVRSRRFGQAQELKSYGVVGAKSQLTPTLSLPAVDAAPLLAQDELDSKKDVPFRFGVKQNVSVNVMDAASKSEQDGYRIYEYQIKSAGAFSLNLIFDSFQLKPGSKLFLYNGDRTMIMGPITDAQNSSSGQFWTDLLEGAAMTIELQEPIAGNGSSILHLQSVVHGYRNSFDKYFGSGGTCHPNMVCYPNNQFQGDGVARIMIPVGETGVGWCSGSMVNNMRQNFRSYFLTAFHCIDGNKNLVVDANESASVANWVFSFNYQSPTCTPSQDFTESISLNGATFRSAADATDFTLLELTRQVPTNVNTTYNGLNWEPVTTSNNYGIHHPGGDVKKISFTRADTEISGYPGRILTTTHLTALWGQLGSVDGGSSGSPLFDGSGRIVGQLHGGPSKCGGPAEGNQDYYGRLSGSWSGSATNDTRLSNWLNPDNATGFTIDGAKSVVNGPSVVTSSGGIYSLNTLNSSIVSWSVIGGAGLVSPTSGFGNSASVTALATAASLTIAFSVADGQAYPIGFSKVFSTSVTTTTPPVSPTVTPPVSPTVTPGGPLALLAPTYNCSTGAITFNPTGGNGSTITYTAVGIQRASATSNTGTVEPGLRADPKPLVITATQNGVTVSQTFNFAAFCAGAARVASAEPGVGLQVRVLGNPTNTPAVSAEILGAEGQPVTVRVFDAMGHEQAVRHIKQAGATETIQLPLGRSAGMYVLDVQSAGQRQSVRVLKIE